MAVYDSCKILDIDGDLLSWCNLKRAKWYIRKERADLIEEDEYTGALTIKLRFKNRGNGVKDNPYYLNKKENKCVVCGSEEELTKHHVVPKCYRKRFPDNIKSFSSHDVLALCESCHVKYEKKAELLKNKIFEDFNIDQKFINKRSSVSKSAKIVLEMDKSDRNRKKMLNFIKNNLGVDNVTNELLKKISNESQNPYDILMSKVDDIHNFSLIWREHFLKEMNPKYLPDMWTREGKWA